METDTMCITKLVVAETDLVASLLVIVLHGAARKATEATEMTSSPLELRGFFEGFLMLPLR